MLVGVDVGTRDDGLDDGLAVRTLASTVGGEGLLSLLEAEAVGNKWLEVDLASSDKSNGELVVTSLEESGKHRSMLEQ